MKKELLGPDPNDIRSFLEGLKEPTASQLRRLEIAESIGTVIPDGVLIIDIDVDSGLPARPGVLRNGLSQVAMSPEGQTWDGPSTQIAS